MSDHKSKHFADEDLAAKIIYHARCLCIELEREPQPLRCASTLMKLKQLLNEEQAAMRIAIEQQRSIDEPKS